jgi:hypothetical protein
MYTYIKKLDDSNKMFGTIIINPCTVWDETHQASEGNPRINICCLLSRFSFITADAALNTVDNPR